MLASDFIRQCGDGAGSDDGTSVDDREAVGQLFAESEVLLDQQDAHFVPRCAACGCFSKSRLRICTSSGGKPQRRPHGNLGVRLPDNDSVSLGPVRRSAESRKGDCEKFHKVLASLLRAGFSGNPLALGICHPGGFLLPLPCVPQPRLRDVSRHIFGHDRPIS